MDDPSTGSGRTAGEGGAIIGPAVFSLDEALSRVDHDVEILHTMAAIFVDQGPKDLEHLQAALASGDAAAVARDAHRLKGALLQFCAPAVFEATKELEAWGQAGDLTSARAACARLETELPRLLAALRGFLAGARS
jgi:histidine phosphotransfer protein HptB